LNKKRILIIGVVVVALGIATWWWLRPDPLQVSVISVSRGEVVATVANTRAGTVEACRRSGLAPAIGGQLASLPIQEGDRVNTGQVLLELWNEDRKAELLMARRDVVATQGRADEICVRADIADREAKRLIRLRERGLAAEEETDRAVGDSQAKAAGCKAATDAVKVSNAQVEIAKARLELTILRAPFDGVVAEINGELGEFVTPSPIGVPTPPAVDLIDASCLYISAPIDEVDAPAVRAGQEAIITLDAFPTEKFPGIVRRVAPYVLDIEKQARTVEIEAEINQPPENSAMGDLLPGYSADIEVILATRLDVLRVPTQVILDGNRVFIFENGVLHERLIQTGISNWEQTEVIDGLTDGDFVVLSVDRDGVEDGAVVTPDYQ
jgi:HlyD family secretion protein